MIRMYLLTMRKVLMDALVFFLFTNQMLHISGTMTVFRGPSTNYQIYSSFRKLICISEDDGGALVWNNNLNWRYHKNMSFSNLNGGIPNCEINCKMNADEDCLKLWVQRDWSLTNSVKTPMGPVFDQRWEEFQEYASQEDRYKFIDFEDTIAAKLSISIRGFSDAHILLCNSKSYYHDFCYWIIIGGWNNTVSVIRKCAMGVPLIGTWPEENSNCRKTQVSFQHMPLSETEWRSFIITWNSVTRNISVYDTDNIIMTYKDAEEHKLPNITYHLFIRSNEHILFRFHIYNFLRTTLENAILTSPIVQVDNETICVQMLIGLCPECDAHITLRDTNYKLLEMMIVKGSSKAAIHGLPMWQFVQIQKSLSRINYKNVILQIIPKLSALSSNPLWAIANVRRCPRNDSFRRSMYNVDENSFWPITCQKLFYDDHTIVNSMLDVKSDMKFDHEDCPPGKIGPQCLIDCGSNLGSYNNCEGTVICYKDGCTCPPGFLGSKCSTSCKSHTYGYGCKKECGACREISIYKQRSCDAITGMCYYGCENLYIPPLCQLKIDKLNAPEITSTSTSIQIIIPMTWKKEYENITISYSCTLQGPMKHHVPRWKKVFPNTTQLIGYFKNLAPGTTYQISCGLKIEGTQELFSDWQNAETNCNPVEGFDVKPEETSIIIDWQINADQLYPCPVNKYRLIVQNLNTDELIFNESVMYFPYNLSQLTSYTLFNVTILYKNNELFSTQIRTLEGVPSSVLDLKVMISSNTLNLIWRPPYQPNGEIMRYEVTLKIKEYYGCTDLSLPTTDNHIITKITKNTTITIPNLHPYASYSIQVIAHNSRYNSMAAERSFDTKSSEIPTEVFSHLEVQDWKLSWDPPEDCTAISGPIKAKIKIRGISDAVKDKIYEAKQTSQYFFDLSKIEPNLHGAERYLAKIYVIRGFWCQENDSAYQEYEFETPPTAPPSVINLEVIEIDSRQTPAMIHLRWQSPRSPLNGKLHYYGIQSCKQYYNKNCPIMEVQLNKFCDLWDDYICQMIQKPFTNNPIIRVLAYNMNVTESSPPVYVTNQMLSNTIPDAPENFTFTINNNSVIELKWHHPWRTGGHLQSFHIYIKEIDSYLRKQRLVARSLDRDKYEYQVAHYMRNYSERLYLFPSTQYHIAIHAVTVANKSSQFNFIDVYTPSTIDFDGDLKVMIDKFSSTILLNIPPVLNDTCDSKMHIIVKGPNACEQHSKVPENLHSRANIKMYDIAWQAAEVSTNDFAGKLFMVGDNRIYGGARNCPLKPGESYEIVIMVIETNSSKEPIMLAKSIRIGEVPSKHHEAWIIPIILLLVIAGAAFYLYQRKKQKLTKHPIQDEMALSQNVENYEYETKSVISNSKQELSTPSNRQSLSQPSTPEVPLIVEKKDEEMRKETTSLTKVKDFEDYVREAIQSGLLDEQYETFPKGQTRPWDYGKLTQNKSKNRYGNLIAYDETRVILKKLPDDDYSDYINANYITGYKQKKRYIATQGPKPSTVIDFWRMIWQENVLIICMLANVIENGKKKCEQYWPDIGKKKKYGDVIVLNAKHNVFADYCFRTFQITCGEETRKIEHLHYTAWPDHGVPLYTHAVVTYLKKLLATPPGNGPVVVHCSAGVGRTGTIILCDICLHRAAAEGLVDVFAETASIRSERANMVDNKQQYLLAHLALVECLLSIPTTLPCNDLLPARIKELKKQLIVQQQRLQNIAWQDEALRQFTSPPSLSEKNRAKNRFPELISDKVSRIYLKRYPASDEDSDYLSAVYVDGVKLQNQYLATQLPMPSTVNDFWRMIAEFKVELILMLQPPDLQDPTCCVIAPASGEFKPTPYLNITAKEVIEFESYTSQKLLLVDNSEKPSREQYVTILCLTEWKSGRNQPPPPVMTMVTLWQAAERIARGDGPTVTLCHDGVTGCGLYLALSFLLERMAVERECDVCLAVRAVRRSRPDFVRSLEQLEFLYDAAMTYLEYFETYANFS